MMNKELRNESKNVVKFLALDSFINDNFDKLSNEDYEYLVNVLEQLIKQIHYKR